MLSRAGSAPAGFLSMQLEVSPMAFLRGLLARRSGRPRGKTVAARAAAVAVMALAGCGWPPTENVIVDCSGQSVRLSTIDAIKSDTTTTDEEKRQQLIDMCITDEQVIDVLLK